MTSTSRDLELGVPSWSEEYRDEVKDIIKPAMIKDIKDMISGRVRWRRAAVAAETLGKISSASSAVLAFAGASDLAGGEASRIIGFAAGTVATLGMVLTMLANFSRSQSIERTDALNLILEKAHIEPVPEIDDILEVNESALATVTEE